MKSAVHWPGIDLAVEERVARLTVGTGQRRNALSEAGWVALAAAAEQLRQRTDVDVTVIAGLGADFCSGSDIYTWVGADIARVNGSFAAMESAFQAVERLEMPTVAMMTGVAAGAGCQLALACDLRVMASSGRIGMPIASLGILAPAAFAARITRLAGPQRSLELLYTGALLPASEAVRIGLVSDHVAEEDLESRVREFVDQLLSLPPTALRAAKSAVRSAWDPTAAVPSNAVDMTVFSPAVTAFAAEQPPSEAELNLDAARLRAVVFRLFRQLREHDVAGLTPAQLSALAMIGRSGPMRLSDLAAFVGGCCDLVIRRRVGRSGQGP